MAWSLTFTVFVWVTALVLSARLSVWLALRSTGQFRRFLLLLMRAPAVLLADVWFRGCADKTSLYGTIADLMERAEWWSDKWPGNHIVYLKYLAIAVAFCLVFVHDEVLLLIYKFFFNRMATIQIIYILLQQSLFRVGQSDESQTPILVYDAYVILDSLFTWSQVMADEDAVCEGFKEMARALNENLRKTELPEWLANRLTSVIGTTLSSVASTNSNLVGSVLILAPHFVTTALDKAGLSVWWIQWINGAMCRALALILLIVVLFYIIVAVCTIATDRNASPIVTVTISWLTLCALNVVFHMAFSTSTSTNVVFDGLNDSLKSLVAYIGFSITIGYVYLGVFRVIIWYAGIGNANIDFSAVQLGQTIIMLLYGLDMYIFAQPSAQNSFIGALTVILQTASHAVIAHVQPVIESGVRSRTSSINALLLFCLVLFFCPLLATYLVLSSFGPTDWCSQTILVTLFSCLHAVKFIGSYVFRKIMSVDGAKRERYLRSFEKISIHASWTMACAMILYYIAIFLSVDWSFTALYKAAFVTIAFVYKPYADHKISTRRREMASRLVSSFPAPNISNRELADIDCPICLISLNRQNGNSCRAPCGHLFHSNCLTEWVRVKVTCPMCNRKIGNLDDQADAPFNMDQLARLREFQQQMEMLQQLFAPAANEPQVQQQMQMWQQLFANINRQ